jgi:uncharacterized protein YigE (DUF2233 family)
MIRALAALLLLAVAACEAPEQATSPFAPKTTPAAAHCAERSFEGTRFTVCRFDARAQSIELVVSGRNGPLRSFAALEEHLGGRTDQLLFAMNAGMYDEEGRPIGLYVEDGEERRPLNLRPGPGNFHLRPNGVFAVDGEGRVSVTRSDRFRARVRSPRWATQSGPMLVVDGALHPEFDANGQSQLVRNGVGVSDANTAWFAISEEGVSFGRFARLFRDALGCRNALFLDGSVSSLWDPGAGRRDAYSGLGPMILAFRR